MNIEDLIILLPNHVKLNLFDTKVIESFYGLTVKGIGLTEKQRILSLKILKRYQSKLETAIQKDITDFLKNPVFKFAERKISSVKKVSIVDDQYYTKAIKVEFPFNEELIKKIKENRSNFTDSEWNPSEKAWKFPLHERNIDEINNILSNLEFDYDDTFKEYVDTVNDIKNNIEKYVPMVSKEDSLYVFKNISQNILDFQNLDLVETLITAKNYGIHTWSDEVDADLEKLDVSESVVKFLKTGPGEPFQFFLGNEKLSPLADIVKHLLPCVFIIPGGSEMSYLQLSLEFLENLGVSNSDISVLFRLPKETNQAFNDFVKQEGLNNRLSGNTKVIFLSGKIPKPLIESNIKTKSIINFSFYSIHHMVKNFIKNHQNVIEIKTVAYKKEAAIGVM